MPPMKPSVSIEDALARIAELEHANKNATEERDRHRKKLSTYEDAEKAAQQAALSEVEKVTKRAEEAEQRIKAYQQQLVTAQVKLAAQAKGIIDPDLAALAIAGQLELGEDGMPTNIDKTLDSLIKSKPYLAPKPAEPPAEPAAPATPAQTATQTRPPMTPAMNPGRTNITPPGQTSGKHPSKIGWGDVYTRP